jgi:hypothetical protein
MKKLNARQQAFVDIYTNPESRGFGNATKAAELAGYSKKTAGPQGRRLLRNVTVSEEVRRRQQAAAKAAELDRETFIHHALQMARAGWLDENGQPVMEPRGVDGQGKPVLLPAKPNSANVKGLELAARAAGLLDTEEAGAETKPVHNIYIGAELPPTRRPARLEEIETDGADGGQARYPRRLRGPRRSKDRSNGRKKSARVVPKAEQSAARLSTVAAVSPRSSLPTKVR